MDLHDVILPFLATFYIAKSQCADYEAQYKLVERFLTVKNLDSALLYTCWSVTDRVKSMNALNGKKIAIAHRNRGDFDGNNRLKDLLKISLYSPDLGLVIDWSCNEDVSFRFSESWLWNASYHWLMMLENKSNKNIQSFLTSKNINLTINSEVLLVYPDDTDDRDITNWHIFDVYRTAYAPRGQLMIDVVNETFGKWGNRLWKFERRSNLQNLTLNAVAIGILNQHGTNKNNGTGDVAEQSSEELIKYLTLNLERLNTAQKFSYAIMYSITKIVLNITMNIKITKSWGYKINNKWDGIVGILESREADFSITLNAMRIERLSVVDYSAISTWIYQPTFIYRRPRLSSTTNIFLQPFDTTVWIYLIGIMLLSAIVYYTIIRWESNRDLSRLKILSDVFLLKIGALCQQGTTLEPTKLSNRLIVLLVFVFSLVVYQFYSSSIVSGLLRPTILTLDSVRKLDESGLAVGVENLSIVTKVMEVAAEVDPIMRNIVEKKIKPKSQFLSPLEGVKKVQKGYYVFLAETAHSYWLVSEIFSEREKCDLAELTLNRPEAVGFMVQKNSPYRELFNYANNIVMETGLMDRENRIWHAEKPECVVDKTLTEDDLVSVEIKDVSSLLIFMLISFIISFIILILEIIVFRYNAEKSTPHDEKQSITSRTSLVNSLMSSAECKIN